MTTRLGSIRRGASSPGVDGFLAHNGLIFQMSEFGRAECRIKSLIGTVLRKLEPLSHSGKALLQRKGRP
jgi:hypothetical protein